MKSVIVESNQLTKVYSKASDCRFDLYEEIVGGHVLQSLREQKREKLFCDVSIQCEGGQVKAHRCVLYAVSGYCRTLFMGSLPPTYENGILIMELDLFSYDTVTVFIDLVYGAEASKVSEVDVGELLRLADFLQVAEYMMTDILRQIIDKANCLKLYDLSISYNCFPLQKVLESYICNKLEDLGERSSWDLSETSMSRLRQNPLYLELSCTVAMETNTIAMETNTIDLKYMLIACERYLSSPSTKCKTWSTENDECFVHDEVYFSQVEREILYFIFQYELYAIISISKDFSYNIYKYNQQWRHFKKVLSLTRRTYSTPTEIPLPSQLPEVMVKMVIPSLLHEHIFLLCWPKWLSSPGNDLWILKVTLGRQCNPTIELEERITGITRHYSVLCASRLYFLYQSQYHVYDFDTRSTMHHELTALQVDEEIYCRWRYCAFQNIIYAFVVMPELDKMQVLSLNEDGNCWTILSEHDIKPGVVAIYAVSVPNSAQPNDLFLILCLNLPEDELLEDEYVKAIYQYDPHCKHLTLWKEYKFINPNPNYLEHLFVPDYLSI